MKLKKNKSCNYDNERCFNLDEKLEEDKKVVAKDVFEGYSSKKSENKKPKSTKRGKISTKTVIETKKKKKY